MNTREEYKEKIYQLGRRGMDLVETIKQKYNSKKESLESLEGIELKSIDAEIKKLMAEVGQKFPIKYKSNTNEDYEAPVDNRTFNDRVRDAYESGIDMGGSWTGTDKFGNS